MKTRGIVKWFNPTKGFGFIETVNGDAFVHYTQIEGSGYKTLMQGIPVELELKETPRGMFAANVKPILGPMPTVIAPGTVGSVV